jgi:hypothetical protein
MNPPQMQPYNERVLFKTVNVVLPLPSRPGVSRGLQPPAGPAGPPKTTASHHGLPLFNCSQCCFAFDIFYHRFSALVLYVRFCQFSFVAFAAFIATFSLFK